MNIKKPEIFGITIDKKICDKLDFLCYLHSISKSAAIAMIYNNLFLHRRKHQWN